MIFERKTLAQPATFEGVGLHSGAPVKMTVHPGSTGIAFRIGSNRIEARPESVTETTRCTRLGEVSTIEHLMSAFAGLEITDAEVELTAPELPGMDGSALPFCQELIRTGFETIGEADSQEIFARIFLVEEDVRKLAVAKGAGHWRYLFDLGDRWPGTQEFECLDVVEKYVSEIAPARTLVLTEEIERAKMAGLGRGLNETSVLVIGPEGYQNRARFLDEPARHKLLDLMGDLYLAGIPPRHLNVVAERTGHRMNAEMASRLAANHP